MPMTAERATVGLALALDAREKGGVQGVALRAVPPLAGAAVFSFVLGGFFHAEAASPIYKRTGRRGRTFPG